MASDYLCRVCGIGFILPSGRCDHCDNELREERQSMLNRMEEATRKESTETAAEWIARHGTGYSSEDGRFLDFFSGGISAWAEIEEIGECVSVRVETADDCEMLCKILRVTPVERKVG